MSTPKRFSLSAIFSNAINQKTFEEYRTSPADMAKVAKYAALPSDFPPVLIEPDGRLQDGNHRCMAAQLRGGTTIAAFVREYPVGYFTPSEAAKYESYIITEKN